MMHIALNPSLVITNRNKRVFPYISEIVEEDKQLLQEAIQRVRPHSKNYEDSWGYVIQATRYGGFKWYDPRKKFLIFFGRKSETDPTLVVVNFFATPSYMAGIVKKIQKTLGTRRTILKNISVDDIERFTSNGFRPYNDTEQWNEFARFDDQTYPQQIVNLIDLVELKGKGYRYLRSVLHKEHKTYIRPYERSDEKAVLDIFAAKDENMSGTQLNKTDGMYYESHAMYPQAALDKFVIIDVTKNEIIGFTALSAITKEMTASVASLLKSGTGRASVWGAYQTLFAMYEKGYKKVNFGGCEEERSYNFVRRTFRPTETIQKTHLVFDL